MVTPITTFGRNGVHDFLLLRCSAVVLATYTLFLLGFFITTPNLTYAIWLQLWSGLFTKVFTLLALFAFLVHTWIGLWQVLTDYVNCTLLRGGLQFALNMVIAVLFGSGITILWGL